MSGLRDPEAIAYRNAHLHDPRIRTLTRFVADLRSRYPEFEFPDFDPFDGGVEADILFLFEKPGPRTSRAGGGSGFISRDNDDPSAEATFRFMEQAGIPRTRTVTWNVVPGWNRTRDIRGSELRWGLAMLDELLPLLPRLTTVVLVGRKAQRARRTLASRGLRFIQSPHPSPIVRASRPQQWQSIPEIWARSASDSSF